MADNASAFAALDAQIARFRSLGTLATDAAPEIAASLRAKLASTIAAGTDFDGEPWKPTKKGDRPLRNAAAALQVRAIGSTVVATLTGPEALHHLGAGRGRVQRRILPGATSKIGRILGLRELFGARAKRTLKGR